MSKLFLPVMVCALALPLASVGASAETAAGGRVAATAAPNVGTAPAASTAASGAQALPAPIIRPKANIAKGGPLTQQQKTLIDRINLYLTSVQTLFGDFVQVGPDGTRSEGKFYLQKPGRMRFEYDDPSPLELIADGKSVAIRDRKLATQDLLLLSQTPLRFLLSDRIDLFREGNLVGVSSDDTFVTLTLEEKQTIGGTHRLALMFSAKDLALKQWTVTDPQGYDTTVALYNVDVGRKLDPDLFKINYERMRN
jgi:outer membrane lipoprotein-sorting protein